MDEMTLASPCLEDDDAMWLRGNIHVHTTHSDGKMAPQEVIDAYAEAGYDFLALTDHDTLGDMSGLDDRGMVLLPGNEVSGNGAHILDIGAKTRVEPHGDRQRVIDAILKESGFPILCHANWTENFDHYRYKTLLDLSGYVGIEIFNGVVIDLPGSHLAVGKWDRLLASGRSVWGYAADDTHHRHQIGRGWNVVRVKEKTPEAILEALRGGSFYASSGVRIDAISCEGPELAVRAANADAIWVFGRHGKRLAAGDGPELRFDASEVMSPYIRFECYGRGDAVAWSQPIAIRGGKYEKLHERLAELNAGEPPVLHVLHAERRAELTGNIDAPLWEQAERSARFFRMSDGEEPEVKTEVRALATDTEVAFAVRCEEPQPDAMRLRASRDDDPNTWADDSVELFLDVKGTAEEYVQVVVNAAGCVVALSPKVGDALREHLKARAGRFPGGWSVELVVPFEALGASGASGTRWRFHVCRNRPGADQHYVWSWVGSSNHTPERFGWLVF